MERENIDSFNVAEFSGEFCQGGDVQRVVGEIGYEHVAQPNRLVTGSQTACEVEHRTNFHSSKTLVHFRVPALDVKQHETDGVQLRIAQAVAQAAVCV